MNLTPALIKEYDRKVPADLDTATFGLGCFWGPDAAFGSLNGVVRTRVGYAGGTKDNPSYQLIGNHTEVVQIEYDHSRISFTELLDYAFDQHNPSYQPSKRQYQNIIFTITPQQREDLDTYLEEKLCNQSDIKTHIEQIDKFYMAEDYHQKYNIQGKRWIMEAFYNAGYNDNDIRDSPTAAKLNAHVAGHSVDVPFIN